MKYDEWNASKKIIWCSYCHGLNEIPDVTSDKKYYCIHCGYILS